MKDFMKTKLYMELAQKDPVKNNLKNKLIYTGKLLGTENSGERY